MFHIILPTILAIGMSLWLVYGLLRHDIAIIAANIFGIACNIVIVERPST
ncbi:MAG: hypothetical protein J7K47_05625 [Thermoplasmata archaeon]|nr:hypothetical protein [Thermoplasmata archaeon]